jgi:hypothetical protein
MKNRPHLLKQLITEGLYVVEERSVASAIVARAQVRATVAEPEFRSARRMPGVRSFRPDPDARSFRLSSPRLRAHHY